MVGVNGMSVFDEQNMHGKTIRSDRCVFCGRPSYEQHHVVPRARGGSKGPTVAVCGWGNTGGCHGRLHSGRLWLRWDGTHWLWLATPGGCSIEEAWSREGWRPLLSTAETVELVTYGRGRHELDSR